eukprot:g8235.t1
MSTSIVLCPNVVNKALEYWHDLVGCCISGSQGSMSREGHVYTQVPEKSEKRPRSSLLWANGLEQVMADALAPIEHAIKSNLGHAAKSTTEPLAAQVGWKLPVIPEGALTTIIPVAFPLDSLPEEKREKMVQKMEVLVALPLVLINRGLCCRCFQRCLSRHVSCYFCFGVVFVLSAVSYMVAKEPDVNANDLFFEFVNLLELLSDKLEAVLMQVSLVLGLLLAWMMRKKILSLLGYDQQVVRADLKDCERLALQLGTDAVDPQDVLTFFQMSRFSTIEVTLWKVEDLPAGFSSRTLFVRMLLGFNEPQHSRPHDGCTTSMVLREKFQLNYDPEDMGMEVVKWVLAGSRRWFCV